MKSPKPPKKSSNKPTPHPKSAPVGREPRLSIPNPDISTNQNNSKKPIFTKVHSKPSKKRKGKDVSDISTQSSSATTPSVRPKPKPKPVKDVKKQKKKPKHKSKAKSKSKNNQKIVKVGPKDEKQDEMSTKKEIESESEVEELEKEFVIPPIRRRVYRSHLRIPGQSLVREEIEDPLTLVEAEFLSEGKLRLQMTRRQLSLEVIRKRQLSRGTAVESEKKTDQEITLTPERMKELEELYPTSIKHSRQSSAISHETTRISSVLSSHVYLLQNSPLIPKLPVIRFTVPIDSRVLKTMTPGGYLRKHSIPAPYLLKLCEKVFDRNQIDDYLLIQDLRKSLSESIGYQFQDDLYELFVQLSDVCGEEVIDLKLFIGYACLLLRILCQELSDTKSQRDHMEKLDFDLLILNFNLFSVNDRLKKLLQYLQSI